MNSNILATLLPVFYCLCSGQFVTVNPDTFRVLLYLAALLFFKTDLNITLYKNISQLTWQKRTTRERNEKGRERQRAKRGPADKQTSRTSAWGDGALESAGEGGGRRQADKLAKPSLAYLAYRLQSSQWFQDCWSNKWMNKSINKYWLFPNSNFLKYTYIYFKFRKSEKVWKTFDEQFQKFYLWNFVCEISQWECHSSPSQFPSPWLLPLLHPLDASTLNFKFKSRGK